MIAELRARSIATARRVREALPFSDRAIEDETLLADRRQPLKITSTTLENGRYPGQLYLRTDTGFEAISTPGDIRVRTTNGEALQLNRFYWGQLIDVLNDGKLVFDVEPPGGTAPPGAPGYQGAKYKGLLSLAGGAPLWQSQSYDFGGFVNGAGFTIPANAPASAAYHLSASISILGGAGSGPFLEARFVVNGQQGARATAYDGGGFISAGVCIAETYLLGPGADVRLGIIAAGFSPVPANQQSSFFAIDRIAVVG